MALRNYSNSSVETTLAVSVSDTDTAIQMASVTGWPAAPFTIIIDPDEITEEACLVTDVVSNTVMVTRGYDGTTAVGHTAGSVARHAVIARDFREANDHVNATDYVHGTASDVVGVDDVQTLTNKTIDYDLNTILNLPPGPTGATGPQGIAGVQIQNDPPSDTSVLWIDPDDPDTTWSVGVPAGGTTGQYLRKSSDLDHVTGWDTITSADVDGLDTQLAGKSDAGHTHSYDPSGTAASAVAAHESDTTGVHGIADTSALVLTTDARLSDARTPTAHAASHASAGSDPITITEAQVTGLTSALAGKAAYPAGGSDGQALIKSGTTAVWGGPYAALTGANFSGAVTAPGVTVQQDTNTGVVINRYSSGFGGSLLNVPGPATFLETQVNGSVAARISGSAARFPAAYSATTANGANVFVDSVGQLFRSTSSIKYKTDVQDATEDEVNAVLQIRPVTYKSLADADDSDKRWWGFIAEEVEQIDPRLVTHNEDGEPEGVQYDRIVPALVGIIQRQQAQIDALTARLDAAGL